MSYIFVKVNYIYKILEMRPQMMKTIFSILLFSLLSHLSLAQSKHLLSMNKMLDIRGANGRNLIITDEESFRVEHLFSEHYVDSITLIPYTGLITINYNGNAIDSIHTLNGYKNGICLLYHTKGSVQKDKLEYYDQKEGVSISRSFPSPTSKKSKVYKFNYISLRFFSEEISIRISCEKNKNGWLVEIYEGDKKSKHKISSLEELKELIRSYKSNVDLLELLTKTNALDQL